MPETDLYKWFLETEEIEEEKPEPVDIYDWYEETTEALEEPAQVDLHGWFKETAPEEIIQPAEPTWWENAWAAAKPTLEVALNKLDQNINKWYEWAYPYAEKEQPLGMLRRSDIIEAVRFLPGNEDLPPWEEMDAATKARVAIQAGALPGTLYLGLANAISTGLSIRDWVRLNKQVYGPRRLGIVKEAKPAKWGISKTTGQLEVKKIPPLKKTIGLKAAPPKAPKIKTLAIKQLRSTISQVEIVQKPTFKTDLERAIYTKLGSITPTHVADQSKIEAAQRMTERLLEFAPAQFSSEFAAAQISEAEETWIPRVAEQLTAHGEISLSLFDRPAIPEEEKIVEEQMIQPIPDEAKKEFEKFAAERESKEEYVREMLSMSEGESLLSRIKRRGGIKWTPSARDFGNYNQIPRSAVNREGIPFDEMADELGMSDDQLWESLVAYKSRKATMDEKVSEILKRTAPEVAPKAEMPPKPLPKVLVKKLDIAHAHVVRKKDLATVRPEEFKQYLKRIEDVFREEYPTEGVPIEEMQPSGSYKDAKRYLDQAWIAYDNEDLVEALKHAESALYALHPIGYTPRETPFLLAEPEVALRPEIPITPEEKITPREGKPAKIPEMEISEEVKRTEIINQISEKLGVPIRLGHFRERALGIYKKKPKVIRLKAPIDVPTAAHEVGHYLDDKVFKFDLQGYVDELTPLDPSKKENLREGYAEFVSRYVIDRALAETEAPKFFNYFEETISSVPEVKEVLDTTKADYERWLRMPAAAKVASQINYEPDKTGGFGFGKLYTMLIDELYPLKKYTDIARQQGLEVTTEEDPFILATLHRGWHGKADSFLRHKTFDANFKWSGEPLTAILQPVVNKDALKDFDTYLVAKQAIFRLEHDKKVGIDYKDATEALKELEEEHPEFKDLSQRLYDYQDRLLQYARDSGLIGQETYENFSVNLSYVPLHRVIERLGARGVLGKGFANLPNVYKRFKGSEREIIPPTESIVKNTYVIIDAVERNRIAQAMTRLSKLHPELGRQVEKIPGDIAKVATLSEQEIANIVKEQGFNLAPKDVEDLINVFRPSMFLPKGNIIKVVEDGKPTYYEVDPDIYRSLTMMDREQMNIMIRLLAYPARMLRIGAVSLSPEFLVRNPARDAFTAFVYSKAGFIPGLDTMRGLFSTVTRDETYWKWKISGAEHSMLTSLDREYLQQDVKVLMKDRIAKLKNVVAHPIQSAQILAELGEQATRIGEFKLVMEGGKRWWMLAERPPEAEVERGKVLRAGQAARDITLDFARLGTKTRAVNQIIAFWNANVQDLDKIRRSFQENPIRTLWKILLGITVPSIALWAVNKDDERVQELPQWQRDLFWIVPTKKRLWRIPKPFTLGIIFGSGAERTLDYIYDQDPEAIKQLGRNVLRGINPGVLPTAFLPAIEAATNYSFFLERPVVSEALKSKIPELQYSPYTTETAKMIGDALDVSPQKVEYFLRGYTGGFGKLAMETSDAIMRSISDTEEPKRPNTLADVPLIRGFIAREPWGSSESISRFYTLYEKAETGTAAIKQMIDERRREKALEYRDKYPEFRYVKMLRKVAKELSELRKKRNAILESDIDAERKLQAIEDIEKRMTRIARRAVEAMKR